MGDDDDRFAVALHVAHNGKQLVCLLRGEHGSRLVQNQNVRAAVEHLDDLNGLLLRNGHIVDLLIGIYFKTVTLGNLLHRLPNGGTV